MTFLAGGAITANQKQLSAANFFVNSAKNVQLGKLQKIK